MSLQSTLEPNAGAVAARAAARPTRPFYWSVRRELWEGRAIHLAPLIVAALWLVGFILSAVGLPEHRRALMAFGDPAQLDAMVSEPYGSVAMALRVTMVLVSIAYCLGALSNERRDRSILFWKSMPVPDLVTVAAKVAIPLVVLPVITFVVTLAAQALMLLTTLAVLLGAGFPQGMRWFPLAPDRVFSLVYGLMTLTLWLAPVYAYLLLVSAWAKRATFLWAILPPVALSIIEQAAFHTSYVPRLIAHRLSGGQVAAFAAGRVRLALGGEGLELDPTGFFTSLGLWGGLAFAAACVAGAVWLRRTRDPV